MNKKILLFGIPLLLAGIVMAAIIYHTLTVNATISEALSTVTLDLDMSGFPGEVVVQTFVINNAANVPLNTQFTWLETENLNDVVYITDMPKVVELAPGDNDVNATFTYADETPLGDITGTITLERVA